MLGSRSVSFADYATLCSDTSAVNSRQSSYFNKRPAPSPLYTYTQPYGSCATPWSPFPTATSIQAPTKNLSARLLGSYSDPRATGRGHTPNETRQSTLAEYSAFIASYFSELEKSRQIVQGHIDHYTDITGRCDYSVRLLTRPRGVS
jgi:hypothetical protein